jgi:diguanylate cyclase (GGDEF)-like protein
MQQPPTLALGGLENALFTPEEVDALMRVEFARAQRYTYSVACLAIQVDRLDQIQMVHGWEASRAVVRQMVELVKRETRAGDLLGYLVEDRLLALFPHTSAKAARALAQRLVEAARELRFEAGAVTLRVTLSIGLAHNEGHRELAWASLRQVAEEGLAVADAGGGDRCSETELYSLYTARQEPGAEDVMSGLSEVAREVGYRERLEDLVARDGNLEGAVTQLVEEIMSRALREVRDELATRPPVLEEDAQRAYQAEIELLRRRVSKLTESLGLTERELVRLRARPAGADEGVASMYREVQGLEDGEAQAELKRQLMESIFQANLGLQGRAR